MSYLNTIIILFVMFLAIACDGNNSSDSNDDSETDTFAVCAEGWERCENDRYLESCINDEWIQKIDCGSASSEFCEADDDNTAYCGHYDPDFTDSDSDSGSDSDSDSDSDSGSDNDSCVEGYSLWDINSDSLGACLEKKSLPAQTNNLITEEYSAGWGTYRYDFISHPEIQEGTSDDVAYMLVSTQTGWDALLETQPLKKENIEVDFATEIIVVLQFSYTCCSDAGGWTLESKFYEIENENFYMDVWIDGYCSTNEPEHKGLEAHNFRVLKITAQDLTVCVRADV